MGLGAERNPHAADPCRSQTSAGKLPKFRRHPDAPCQLLSFTANSGHADQHTAGDEQAYYSTETVPSHASSSITARLLHFRISSAEAWSRPGLIPIPVLVGADPKMGQERRSGRVEQRRRRKIPLACEPCRERKSRCDGAKPICSTCQRRSLPLDHCIYTLENARTASNEASVVQPQTTSKISRTS